MQAKLLREYARAQLRALWFGFGLTDSFVAVVVIILSLTAYFAGKHLDRPSGAVTTASALAFILFQLIRASFQVYVNERAERERLRQQPCPQLVAETPNLAATHARAGSNRRQMFATYVRVSIRNISEATAQHCAAKLHKIEYLDRTGWRQLPYNDVLLDMAWANTDRGTREIELAPDGSGMLDVVYTVRGGRELRLATISRPNYPNLMRQAGHYQFTLHLTSADANSRIVRLRIHWGFEQDSLGFPSDPLDQEPPLQ